MNVILVVEDVPPSNNVFLGKKGTNWKYNRIKKEWDNKIKTALIGVIPKEPYRKARVHIHYTFPDRRRRDPDNYAGKMILDPLVKYGVITDDSFKVVKLELSAEVIPKVKRTNIEVDCIE